MKSVFEYLEYREFLKDYYEARKKTRRGFSYRAFADICGMSSPVFFKLVIEGDANLSEKSIKKISDALKFTAKEEKYFSALVSFNQAGEFSLKEYYLNEMIKALDDSAPYVLNTDQYDFYKNWYNSVLRELVPNIDFKGDYLYLGSLLIPKIKIRKTKKALKLLEDLKLVKKKQDGSYEQNERIISTGPEISSIAVRNLHYQMAELARDSLDAVPPEERDMSGMTVGISGESFKKIKYEIAALRKRISSIVAEDPVVERVYRLNFYFFPLTEKIPGRSADNKREVEFPDERENSHED